MSMLEILHSSDEQILSHHAPPIVTITGGQETENTLNVRKYSVLAQRKESENVKKSSEIITEEDDLDMAC